MNCMFRGELLSKEEFIHNLSVLKETLENDLRLNPLKTDEVIEAVHQLASEMNPEEIINKLSLSFPKWVIEDYMSETLVNLNKEKLKQKIEKELGNHPFEWRRVTDEIEEKHHPLGIMMHIGAGNALGLSAFSVLEGLLTGNINILKLPTHEGGVSLEILSRLIKIEPRLKPYIYVMDIPSKDMETIKKIMDVVNAVVIWGSDEAIQSIRTITPPPISIIEWGHRLSFAYFTKNSKIDSDLHGLAKDIVLTDQLYCSSPQCVFYEADHKEDLIQFATNLYKHIEEVALHYPSSERPMDVESQITWSHELIKMEEVLNLKKLIHHGNQFSVMVDFETSLKPSPLFRHIWVMPVKRNELFSLLRKEKGHLQTVGLSCNSNELDELSNLFYSAGVNRITSLGLMSSNYNGEPHDGIFALQRYIRIVNRRIQN